MTRLQSEPRVAPRLVEPEQRCVGARTGNLAVRRVGERLVSGRFATVEVSDPRFERDHLRPAVHRGTQDAIRQDLLVRRIDIGMQQADCDGLEVSAATTASLGFGLDALHRKAGMAVLDADSYY